MAKYTTNGMIRDQNRYGRDGLFRRHAQLGISIGEYFTPHHVRVTNYKRIENAICVRIIHKRKTYFGRVSNCIEFSIWERNSNVI